ncbi:hypothetical protein DRQ20_05470 [bacterium]|nr:MAG: hypothetical protein DRQ20_05470 [bacterium]
MSKIKFYHGGKGEEYPRMIKVEGRWMYVEVVSSSLFENEEREWIVKGEDGCLYRVKGKDIWTIEKIIFPQNS